MLYTIIILLLGMVLETYLGFGRIIIDKCKIIIDKVKTKL
jgi:hypothetical protein